MRNSITPGQQILWCAVLAGLVLLTVARLEYQITYRPLSSIEQSWKWLTKSETFEDRGDQHMAYFAALKSMQLAPDKFWGHFQLGFVLYNSKRYFAAMQAFEQANSILPSHSHRQWIARCNQRLLKDRMKVVKSRNLP